MKFTGVVTGKRLADARNAEKEVVTVIEIKILVPYSPEADRELGQFYRSTVAGELETRQVCLGFE